MKTKHTPGPWTVNGRWVSQGEHRTICNATEMTMKSLVRQAAEYEQACANAQLISAAPEMIEALEMLSKITIDGDRNIGNFECLTEALRLGVNALNKVKGEL